MNIHEYQAKALLQDLWRRRSPRAMSPRPPQEAAAHAQTLGGETFVVKAQIHAGGRGKGGGIKLVKTLQELHAEADRMLGKPLVTPQTGPKGRLVRRVYVVKDATIARELYLSLLVDRVTGRVAFVASTEGGVEHRSGGREHAGEDRHADRRSGHRRQRLPWPGDRLGAQARRRARQAMRRAGQGALPTVRRQGREPDRDQSAGRHQGGQSALPRRQDRLRRQRAVPPQRHRRACATSTRRTRPRSRPPSTICLM